MAFVRSSRPSTLHDRQDCSQSYCGEGVSFSTLIYFPTELSTRHEQQETQINLSLSAETLIIKLISASISESDPGAETLSCGHRVSFNQFLLNERLGSFLFTQVSIKSAHSS